MVEQHIAALQPFLDLDRTIVLRDRELTNDQAHAAMVAALLMRGGKKPDEVAADALTEEYLDAIEDLPAWAVREALRKWNRGESARLDGKPHNFEFRPAPATLARLARLERWVVHGRIVVLQDILNAQPLIDYSPEHRRDMLGKLSAVSKHLEAAVIENEKALAAQQTEARRRAARMSRANALGREADALAEKAAAE